MPRVVSYFFFFFVVEEESVRIPHVPLDKLSATALRQGLPHARMEVEPIVSYKMLKKGALPPPCGIMPDASTLARRSVATQRGHPHGSSCASVSQ